MLKIFTTEINVFELCLMKYLTKVFPVCPTGLDDDLNFQGHLSRRTSEIENLLVLHEMTPVRAIIYVIIFLIIDLSCRTRVIIIQPVRGAIFPNFYLSRTVGQSLRLSPVLYGSGPILKMLSLNPDEIIWRTCQDTGLDIILSNG